MLKATRTFFHVPYILKSLPRKPIIVLDTWKKLLDMVSYIVHEINTLCIMLGVYLHVYSPNYLTNFGQIWYLVSTLKVIWQMYF